MSEITTLADVERLCWRLSGWQVEQRDVDTLLAAVTAYAGHGPDAQPQGAGALAVDGGAGAAERPAGATQGASASLDASEGGSGPQTGIQRLHVTGTLTLACTGHQAAPLSGQRKLCPKCGNRKPIEAFSPDTKGINGRRYACRDCENKRKREGRAARKRKAAR